MMNDLIAALRKIAERDEATGIASRLAAAIDTPPCKAEDDGTHEGAIGADDADDESGSARKIFDKRA